MTDFDHKNLDVYRVALEFASSVGELCARLPSGCAFLAEQLRRAATSICLNIAEGSGEFSPGEKARFYRIAKRSATECAAILDIAELWENRQASDQETRRAIHEGNERLLRIVSMLVKITKRCVDLQQSDVRLADTGNVPGTGTGARAGTTGHGQAT